MNIDSDMQSVLDYFGKFDAAPIETLEPNAARNNPTMRNAVEEMASQSVTVRTMNVAIAEPS